MKYIISAAFCFLLGCNASIETLCEDVAILQCQKCSDCGADEAQAAAFCSVSCQDGLCQDCVQTLVDRCSTKSAVLAEPKDALDKCETTIGDLQCSTLVLAQTQGHDSTVSACVPFF